MFIVELARVRPARGLGLGSGLALGLRRMRDSDMAIGDMLGHGAMPGVRHGVTTSRSPADRSESPLGLGV